MAKKHMKGCPISLVIRKSQSKTTPRSHFAPTPKEKIKRRLAPSYVADRYVKIGTGTLENSLENLNLNIHILHNLLFPPLSYLYSPEKLFTCAPGGTFKYIHGSMVSN